MTEPAHSQRSSPPPVQAAGLRLRFVSALPSGLALFGLWLVLSPHRDLFHLSLGAATAVVVALLAARLVAQPPALGTAGPGHAMLRHMPWHRFGRYLPWLAWRVVVASCEVAYTVLHPRLPISPRMVRITTRYAHTLARLTLANSITLTPGTVTVDVEDDVFLVHALTEKGARDLETDGGTMAKRVSALFHNPDDAHGH
ncbi:MAG: Na+/H+ antiporter subunit E [Acidobacteria bacterium]|nr:Na+/H+ antiporter subunit E [Acidobacteriota bacterium]